MSNDVHYPQPPKGFSRFLYRLPILIYRMGLGFLLGKRFLLLEHIGRKTGLVRRAVLEVIRRDEVRNVYYVVSAFGDQADWYRNILRNPTVRIQVGRTWWAANARSLEPEASQKEILDYAERNPRVFRVLAERLLGYEVGESDEDLVTLAGKFIVVQIGMKMGNGENKEKLGSETV